MRNLSEIMEVRGIVVDREAMEVHTGEKECKCPGQEEDDRGMLMIACGCPMTVTYSGDLGKSLIAFIDSFDEFSEQFKDKK